MGMSVVVYRGSSVNSDVGATANRNGYASAATNSGSRRRARSSRRANTTMVNTTNAIRIATYSATPSPPNRHERVYGYFNPNI